MLGEALPQGVAGLADVNEVAANTLDDVDNQTYHKTGDGEWEKFLKEYGTRCAPRRVGRPNSADHRNRENLESTSDQGP